MRTEREMIPGITRRGSEKALREGSPSRAQSRTLLLWVAVETVPVKSASGGFYTPSLSITLHLTISVIRGGEDRGLVGPPPPDLLWLENRLVLIH